MNELTLTLPLWLDGTRVIPDPERTLTVASPWDGSILGEVALGDVSTLNAAVASAHAAFQSWSRAPNDVRRSILERVRRGLEVRLHDLARCIALEAGKPISDAEAEVTRSIQVVRVAGEEAGRMEGQWLDLDWTEAGRGRQGLVASFPRGVVAAITPFNFPLNLVLHKVAPALACGATCVVKPSPRTPMTALMLGEILHEAGLPPGVVNVVTCPNESVQHLVAHPLVRVVSFTGSPAIGWAMKGQLPTKEVLLELGGNAGLLIDEGSDLEQAARRAVLGAFANAGQVCISLQRIYVVGQAYERFVALLAENTRALAIGDPLDPHTQIGPMISVEAARQAGAWIAEAVAAGARLVCGGTRDGALLAPAVLTGTDASLNVVCKEVFAPIVSVIPVPDFDTGLAAINDSPFGLQAGVFTDSVERLMRAWRQLEVGGVIHNDIPTFRVDHMPYGGSKRSGNTREGLRYTMEAFTESRLLVLQARLRDTV
ncbi:MAG: hypothetical protein AUJ55_00325 [Proteobacteria bacterium CG1_02_64_396]|nr:MAG: hypothetical protein AUJ55_00325 [Proteobacteria bacterium CG1_02_64_396]